jgi:hypothetical protein
VDDVPELSQVAWAWAVDHPAHGSPHKDERHLGARLRGTLQVKDGVVELSYCQPGFRPRDGLGREMRPACLYPEQELGRGDLVAVTVTCPACRVLAFNLMDREGHAAADVPGSEQAARVDVEMFVRVMLEQQGGDPAVVLGCRELVRRWADRATT